MDKIAAMIALDENSTNWSVRVNFDEAVKFSHKRTVVYTRAFDDTVVALADIMGDDYSILTVGRESARVLYLEWYIGHVPESAFSVLRTFSTEFDIDVNPHGGWAKLRMCWC